MQLINSDQQEKVNKSSIFLGGGGEGNGYISWEIILLREQLPPPTTTLITKST